MDPELVNLGVGQGVDLGALVPPRPKSDLILAPRLSFRTGFSSGTCIEEVVTSPAVAVKALAHLVQQQVFHFFVSIDVIVVGR